MEISDIEEVFADNRKGNPGILGVAPFRKVYNHLMPVQQRVLRGMGWGKSVIVMGIFHSPEAISSINVRKNGKTDYKAWNRYAREYHRLNTLLNQAARSIADFVKGIPILATLEGVAATINRVEDFYALTVSQRVGAELAGLGWRGKNELIVTRERGCALRFASVICPEELDYGQSIASQCGNCTACLKACPFLRKKESLKNYREQCRRFIVTLGLDGDVCGKCIKACYEHWTTL